MINQNVTNEQEWIKEGISKNTKYNTRTGNKCTNTFAFAYHAVNKKNFGILYEKYCNFTPYEALLELETAYKKSLIDDKYASNEFEMIMLATAVYFDFERIWIDAFTAIDYRMWNINNSVAKTYNPNINKMIINPWRYETVRACARCIICK